MPEQVPFTAVEFAENPEPRCPCVLLLDNSGSMAGDSINELNSGLVIYKDELAADALAMKRVEVALVTFGGSVQIANEFTTVDQFSPPTLNASGATPMGEAIVRAIELLQARKSEYKANGIVYYRPWIFMLTDGGPTDSWQQAADRVRQGESSKSFMFFAVGTKDANFDVLKQISVREPLKLDGLKFRQMFQWLSSSQSSVAKSNAGDEVPLANPTGPSGWGSTT